MKNVIITGVSTGFGNYIAKQFIQQGYHVIGTTRNVSKFNDDELVNNSKCTILELDLGKSQSIANFANIVLTQFQTIDVLINNAGYAVVGSIEETSMELFRHSFEVNVLGPIDLTKQLLPTLRQSKGTVINMSSLLGVKTFAGFGVYSASKFAIEGLTESLSQELKKFGVKTVLIEPGAFKTNFATDSLIGADKPLEAYGDYSDKFKFDLTNSNDKRQQNIELIWTAIQSAIDPNDKSLRIMVGEKAKMIQKLKTEDLAANIIIE
jgi:short-subunit dehydrogenase